MRASAAILGVAVSIVPAWASAQCPVRTVWPAAEWVDASAQTRTAHPAEVDALEQYAFTLTGDDADRRGIRTDGVVIVHAGQLVYEHYGRGWLPTQPHNTWSVTKTFTNALTGIAVQDHAVRLDESLCGFIPSTRMVNCSITLRNLSEFASGIDWQEVYEDASNQASSVLAMLYGVGHRNVAAFVTDHAQAYTPGTTYRYSTGDSSLLASAVHQAMLDHGHTDEWAWEKLFDPLGMTSAVFETDAHGNPVGGSWFYATPKDLARFGYLFLNDGCWDGLRILPEGWVAESTAVSEPFRNLHLETEPGDVQGRSIWLNRSLPELGIDTPWPEVPEDAYAARGHWGQSITVIPSRDLVIVRVGDDRENPRPFDFAHFLSLAMAVAP